MDKDKFRNPEEIKNFKDLHDEVGKVLLLKDEGIVKIVCAVMIAQKLSVDPIWLLLVAPPSGSKSEFINFISGLEYIYKISDLTTNTFASGQKRREKETSLLNKINNGVLAFKDFTSIISKNREARSEIMAQLREIYDGEYTKRTGTGENTVWSGKISAIAGVTEIIYKHQDELASMGNRFILYTIDQPNREDVLERVKENAPDMEAKRKHLRKCFKNYINHVLSTIDYGIREINLPEEAEQELFEVADFATQVRSAVITNFRTDNVEFIPSKEMPMRMTFQLYSLASAFIAMNEASGIEGLSLDEAGLTDLDKKILHKAAFNSIPKSRRQALYALAKYKKGITTAGLATSLNLPTPSTRKYLEKIDALGICERRKNSGPQGDKWVLKDEFREIMVKLRNIDVVDKSLETRNVQKMQEMEELEDMEEMDLEEDMPEPIEDDDEKVAAEQVLDDIDI